MSKAKIVLACFVWLVLLAIGAGVYRLLIVPSQAKKDKEEKQQVLDQTSGSSSYKHTVQLGLDAFSGYAILRSDEMKRALRDEGIKMELVDDGADYGSRIKALASGELNFAAFPIDALLKSSAELGSLPATVIAIIDETQGADAMVAYKSKYPTIESLDRADTRLVMVGNSPSETLARLVLHTFELEFLNDSSFDLVDSENELMRRYRAAKPGGNEVFVTWEPVVSQLVGSGDLMQRVYDSSKQSGIIVDTLVVSRDYLIKNEAVVRNVIASYFRARHAFSTPEKLEQLVIRDAKSQGTTLSSDNAKTLVSGIAWKNTQDNLAHFGLRSASLPHIEDMVDRIRTVLSETGGLDSDPTNGVSNRVFYDKAMVALQTAGFHPGADDERVTEAKKLKSLSDGEWARLQPIGKVAVPPLVYARGTARLTESSKVKLDELVETLKTFPRAYLEIRGDASSRGDAEANRTLAKQRADAALQYLRESGVAEAKMRATNGNITGKTSVTFVLVEAPY
ncbi:MAG: phosphate ABC transporter substrate-binding/OmpA family protein [Planctomycetota bacterium]